MKPSKWNNAKNILVAWTVIFGLNQWIIISGTQLGSMHSIVGIYLQRKNVKKTVTPLVSSLSLNSDMRGSPTESRPKWFKANVRPSHTRHARNVTRYKLWVCLRMPHEFPIVTPVGKMLYFRICFATATCRTRYQEGDVFLICLLVIIDYVSVYGKNVSSVSWPRFHFKFNPWLVVIMRDCKKKSNTRYFNPLFWGKN